MSAGLVATLGEMVLVRQEEGFWQVQVCLTQQALLTVVSATRDKALNAAITARCQEFTAGMNPFGSTLA